MDARREQRAAHTHLVEIEAEGAVHAEPRRQLLVEVGRVQEAEDVRGQHDAQTQEGQEVGRDPHRDQLDQLVVHRSQHEAVHLQRNPENKLDKQESQASASFTLSRKNGLLPHTGTTSAPALPPA